MTIEVVRYSPDRAAQWDGLVEASRNGLFLFRRGYMDYHSDRFDDLSAMAFVDGKLAVVLPASIDRQTGTATSHAGLTFGGPIIGRELRTEVALQAIDALLDALRSWGARELEVRLIPQFLTTYPSAEADYALWRRGFTLVRRDLSTIVPLANRIHFNTSKKQAVAKAAKSGLSVAEGSMEDFHGLLTEVLGWRHGVTPVHTREELERLRELFPKEIVLRTVGVDGQLLAGVLVYRYPTAWHTQYMAASPDGRRVGALDLILAQLLDEVAAAGSSWFSFGTSTTDQGQDLNEGLLWQKESFGGRSVTHDFMRGVL